MYLDKLTEKETAVSEKRINFADSYFSVLREQSINLLIISKTKKICTTETILPKEFRN